MLLTAGAAQAFVLLAQALRGARRPVVVHPQFTEPEAALRNAGHAVERVLLRRAGRLPARPAPGAAPTPTWSSSATPPTRPRCCTRPPTIAALARPGRVLVVDEAFADTTYRAGRAGEPESLAGRRDLPGLVVLRSLTKTWGLAGLRIGYLLGAARPASARLAAVAAAVGRSPRPRWPPPTACAVARRGRRRARGSPPALAADRAHLVARLRDVPGVTVAGRPGQLVRRWCACPAPTRCASSCARRGLRGAPRRHVPRAGPRLAADRGARHCHHRRVRRRR